MTSDKKGNFILLLLGLSILLSLIILILPQPYNGKRNNPSLLESLFQKGVPSSEPGIAVLNIFSPISYNTQSMGLTGVPQPGAVEWIRRLKTIENDPSIKALILRINSPGGTVAATQELYQQLVRLKEKGKIIAVSMGDMAASGAYYISCPADLIVANPATLTGSIGVIMAGFNYTELFKKIGLDYQVIKSGENKDIFSGYRELTEREKNIMQNVIDSSFDDFFNVVVTNRPLKENLISKATDGRIMTGRQALEYGLIDQIGDFEKTVSLTLEMIGEEEPARLIYLDNQSLTFLNMLTSMKPGQFRLPFGLGKSAETAADTYSPLLYLYHY